MEHPSLPLNGEALQQKKHKSNYVVLDIVAWTLVDVRRSHFDKSNPLLFVDSVRHVGCDGIELEEQLSENDELKQSEKVRVLIMC